MRADDDVANCSSMDLHLNLLPRRWSRRCADVIVISAPGNISMDRSCPGGKNRRLISAACSVRPEICAALGGRVCEQPYVQLLTLFELLAVVIEMPVYF
jgi:hypothetical protein